MNEWEKNRRMAESYRQSYPPGTRLELIGMDDPFAPIPAGMRGTVNYVDDQSQIHVKWDNGSGLALIPDTDSFRRLSAKEIEAENAAKGSVVSRLTASKTQPGKEREEGRRQAKPNKKKEDTGSAPTPFTSLTYRTAPMTCALCPLIGWKRKGSR